MYRIVLSSQAQKDLSLIPDRRIQIKISERIDGLSHEPEKQGKPLGGELAGFRSLRAVGQRYRIIYRTESSKVLVYILTLGPRKQGDKKDIYTLAKKLIHLRMV